jgi:HAD superfamily hydrolase (TIGR01458 family)
VRRRTWRGRYGFQVAPVRAVLIDIDGVLTVSWRPLPGAVAAVSRLRERGLATALLTNTTSRTRASVAATLAEAGFPVGADDVLTAPALTAGYLATHYPGARCALLNSGDIRADLTGVTIVDDDDPAPEVVIVGGAGSEFSYPAVNRIFGYLQRGARLVAMHRNLYWRTDAGLQLDGGAFLLGLEAAAHVEAEVVGKPAAGFFAAALDRLHVDAADAMMIGDDVDADVLAAQRSGITGVLVKTGKYRPEAVAAADGVPDHVLDSIADLPALLNVDELGDQA